MLRAIVALGLIIVVGAVSARYARRRLAYETWHFIHLYTYVAVVLAFTHQVAVGTTFTSSSAATGVLVRRLGRGPRLGRRWAGSCCRCGATARHQFRVAAVVPESDNVVSVYITGRDLDKLPAAGRPVLPVALPDPDRWWQANPFSLSAAPDGRTLRLTAKAAGDGQRRPAAHARSAPACSPRAPTAPSPRCTARSPSRVLIAGGVGVTPIRALLEELRGPRGRHLPGRAPTATPSSTTSCATSPTPRAPSCTWSPARRSPDKLAPGELRAAGAGHRATGTSSCAGRRR